MQDLSITFIKMGMLLFPLLFNCWGKHLQSYPLEILESLYRGYN